MKRWRRFIIRLQRSRASIRTRWIYRLFGETLFHPDVWRFRPALLARGAALGLFIAATPTLGIQMLIVAPLAILLRVNLAISLAATWVTNIATAPMFYFVCYRIGLFLLGSSPPVHRGASVPAKWQTVIHIAYPLWVGCLIVGIILAVAGYLAVYYLCALERRYRLKERLRNRIDRRLARRAGSHTDSPDLSGSRASSPAPSSAQASIGPHTNS